MNSQTRWSCWIGGLGTWLALQALALAAPAAVRFLAYASARLAALVLAVPLEPGAEPLLVHPDYSVQVVASCSGWNFFSLLTAALAARTLASPPRGRTGRLLLVLPAAALVTIVTNAGRLAAVLGAGRFVLPHLPPVTAVTFHTALGVAMFLPVLIVACLVWERRVCHA